MNLGDLRTAVRDILGEDSSAWFTDAMLNRAINFSMRELYAEMIEVNENYFGTTALISLVSGTERYTLPASPQCHKVLLVERIDQAIDTTLKPIDITTRSRYLLSAANSSNIEVTDMRWYLLGNQIGFIPVPSSSSTNAIRVYYLPVITDLAADGNSPPTEWDQLHHEVIAWGAILRAVTRDKETYQQYQPNYDRLKDIFKASISNRITQEPKGIVDLDAE